MKKLKFFEFKLEYCPRGPVSNRNRFSWLENKLQDHLSDSYRDLGELKSHSESPLSFVRPIGRAKFGLRVNWNRLMARTLGDSAGPAENLRLVANG